MSQRRYSEDFDDDRSSRYGRGGSSSSRGQGTNYSSRDFDDDRMSRNFSDDDEDTRYGRSGSSRWEDEDDDMDDYDEVNRSHRSSNTY
ncbi:hypothetical protein AZI87_02000 [Bdellovibrio bacteriovorus]|uniref:Uncharacterized protein n=2 Tax=Bdellovibrio bacteriovorus TaxID=959 RepID=A0A162GG12_BDEBC|nr:hypothetical protein AZI87_02000 [Bdellovibrio bacteriovorus]